MALQHECRGQPAIETARGWPAAATSAGAD